MRLLQKVGERAKTVLLQGSINRYEHVHGAGPISGAARTFPWGCRSCGSSSLRCRTGSGMGTREELNGSRAESKQPGRESDKPRGWKQRQYGDNLGAK